MKTSRLGRIETLRRRFLNFDYVCSGHLRHRSLICGKRSCRCKAKPAALHGPYYYWSRRHGGRLVQKVLSRDQAKLVEKAIRNHRKAIDLLRKWETETVRAIEQLKLQTTPKA